MKKYFCKTKFSFLCTPIDIDFCVCVFLVVKLEVDAELVRLARLVSNAFLYTTQDAVIANDLSLPLNLVTIENNSFRVQIETRSPANSGIFSAFRIQEETLKSSNSSEKMCEIASQI